MKKTRQIATLFLVLSMLLCVLGGCGTSDAAVESTSNDADAPETTATDTQTAIEESAEVSASDQETPFFPVEETVTFTGLNMYQNDFLNLVDDPGQLPYFQELESRTNVHLDLTAVNMSSNETIQIMLTAGDLPDIMYGISSVASTIYTNGYGDALDGGAFLDLTPYLEEYMPNYNSRLQDEDVKRYVTTDDGRVFGAIGMYKSGSSVPSTGPVIRADWLEELGLEKPVTYDEYHDVLTAFKNAHPDMSTPIFISPHGGCNANYLSAGYGVATNTILGSSIFIIVDGQVQYSPMLPGYKDYLTMMNQWYTEGLLDHDFYSREENGGNIDPSIITTGNVGIFLTNVSNISAFEEVAKEEDPDFRIEPIRDARLTEDSETHLMSLTSKAEGLTFLSGTVEKEKVETLLR